MKKNTFRLETPLRITIQKSQARELEKAKFYTAAMLYYSFYLEQMILVKYIQYIFKNNFWNAKSEIDKIIQIKDDGRLTFGTIMKMCKPILIDGLDSECNKIKEIRDTLLAHPFFVMGIDKHNRLRLGFYDVNNYRKVIRRIYAIVKTKDVLTPSEHNEITHFLKLGSPLSKLNTIENEEFNVEQILLRGLCVYFRMKIENIEGDLDKMLVYNSQLGKYIK